MKKIVLIAAILVFSTLNLKAQWGSFEGILETNSVSNIETTSATANATFTLTSADDAATIRGFAYNTSGTPTTAGDKVEETGSWDDGDGTVNYSLNLTSLTANQVYYVRAYIQNASAETQYGNQVAFATIPTLGEKGLIALGSLFALGGGFFVWRRMVV
jgi:hypothetical protein